MSAGSLQRSAREGTLCTDAGADAKDPPPWFQAWLKNCAPRRRKRSAPAPAPGPAPGPAPALAPALVPALAVAPSCVWQATVHGTKNVYLLVPPGVEVHVRTGPLDTVTLRADGYVPSCGLQATPPSTPEPAAKLARFATGDGDSPDSYVNCDATGTLESGNFKTMPWAAAPLLQADAGVAGEQAAAADQEVGALAGAVPGVEAQAAMPAVQAAAQVAAGAQAEASVGLETLLRQLAATTAPPTEDGQHDESWTVACIRLFAQAVLSWLAGGQYSFFTASVLAQLSPRVTCEDRDHALAGVEAALRGLQRVVERADGGACVPGTGLLEAIASMPYDMFNQLAPEELEVVRPPCRQLLIYCGQRCDAREDGPRSSGGAVPVATRGAVARCSGCAGCTAHYAAGTAERRAARDLCKAAYAVVRRCRVAPTPFEYTALACNACLDRNASQHLHSNDTCFGF